MKELLLTQSLGNASFEVLQAYFQLCVTIITIVQTELFAEYVCVNVNLILFAQLMSD